MSSGKEGRAGGAGSTRAVDPVPLDSWPEEALCAVLKGTSWSSGEEFFRSLVRHLATALRVRLAFASELAGGTASRVRLLALWDADGFVEPFEYDTRGTPCEHVFADGGAHYPSGVQELFPEDRWLLENGIESYLAVPVYDPSGRPVGHLGVMDGEPLEDGVPRNEILGIFAARAGAEIERARAEEKLRFTQFAVDRCEDSIFWITPEGRFFQVNDAVCRTLGYSREEILSLSIFDIDTRFATGPSWSEFWKELRERGSFIVESSQQTKEGRAFPVETRLNYLEFESEEYGCAIVRDISERKKAEAEGRRLEEQLLQSQKMEALGTLAAGVAHDFNNLLTAIGGWREQVRREIPEGHPAEKGLAGIAEATAHAASLTRSLLTFSRKSSSEASTLDLRALVEGTGSMIRQMLPAAIDVAVEVPRAEEVWVQGDATQLQQVLVNLAVNARDAMPEGGQLRIRLVAETANGAGTPGASRGKAALLVEDTGCGMSREVQSRIFDPFFTTKPRTRGTGLGMSIVQAIVRDHGGELRIDSKEGSGTRVRVQIPCCVPPVVSATETAGEDGG